MPFPEPLDASYVIIWDGQAIQCLDCLAISYHPRDVEELYCGKCKKFHERALPRVPKAEQEDS